MSSRLDGTYTKMLRAVFGVSWKDRKTNEKLRGNLQKITDSLLVRRVCFIGHSWRRRRTPDVHEGWRQIEECC